jgi:diguanylate cyclase (GGDEF)-like protein
VAFVLMNRGILRQQRAAAVQAILGERESHRRSITDPLTELLNRRGLEEAFDARPAGAGDRTLLYLDLDGFKQVNDRLGHAAGDAVLREVGRRLALAIGPDATACRLGGDEFLVLADGLDDAAARRLGGRIITAITAPYQVGGGAFAGIGVSVGVARQRPAASGPPLGLADLMRRADQTLYAAKTAGKGRCILHGAEDAPQVQAA